MANITISPNMMLPIPTVRQDPGPDWANNVVACLTMIDAHNHSPNSGVLITPNGLLINADLSYNTNNATFLRSSRYAPQSAPISNAADLDCVYVSGVDLYYNDGNGNKVRITQSGSVTGSTGTITGLPSGTASASYSSGTFTFQQATNTPATMNVGSVIVGQEIASGYGVTLQASASQAGNYDLTLPAALPASKSYMQSDSSGNLSFATVGYTPLGGIIATFPSLPGAYVTSATTVADANGFVLCAGQTISDVTSPMNGAVIPNLSNGGFIQGLNVDSHTGGTQSYTLSVANLPAHHHTYNSAVSFATSSHTHTYAHIHQWGYHTSTPALYVPSNTSFSATATFTNSTTSPLYTAAATYGLGSTSALEEFGAFTGGTFTAGAIDSSSNLNPASSTPSISSTVSGTTDDTGSGTALNIVPPYITAVYIMRIK